MSAVPLPSSAKDILVFLKWIVFNAKDLIEFFSKLRFTFRGLKRC